MLEPPHTEAVLTCARGWCFGQMWEKYKKFHLKMNIFKAVKYYSILHGHVFVMDSAKIKYKKNQKKTRFDVYETLCPQQMLVHKGGQIENWSGECRDMIPTKLQCQTIQRALQSPNLQREITRKKNIFFFNFHQLIY